MTTVVSARYLVTSTRGADALEDDLSLLDAAERTRRDAFAFARDRREFVAAHALLRRMLSRYRDVPAADWRFEAGPFGKPFVPEGQAGSPPIAFSLSHTRDLVACAVGEAEEVGVDVEPIDRPRNDVDKLAERYFAAREVDGLRALPEAERRVRFTDLWVLKEAYIKAIGVGLAQPLQSFGFDFAGAEALRFTPPAGDAADCWRFVLFAVAGRFRLAAAVRLRDASRPLEIVLEDAAQTPSGARLLRQSAAAV